MEVEPLVSEIVQIQINQLEALLDPSLAVLG